MADNRQLRGQIVILGGRGRGCLGVGGGEELTEAEAQTSIMRWRSGMSCAGGGDEL